jgi:asparagine synthase (glutamine-hydrolysing)
MCGIAGFLSPTGLDTAAARATLRRMSDRLHHRGPDDEGAWIDAEAGIALGHRRLAVIDLTEAGRQPMTADSGRYVLVYNGEIYNHAELRAALGDRAWRGHSDTETLLAGIDTWGLVATLQRAVGMFAVALWDRHERRLSLARDRAGEKPLFWGRVGTQWVFASELKSIRQIPGFQGTVDRDSLAAFVGGGYVPAPRSIYEGVYKLVPGAIVQLAAGMVGDPVPRPYWSLAEVVARGLAQPFRGDACEAVDELEHRLVDAVRGQMIADVPLGAFLSGGIDSSTVVALMQRLSPGRVKTYTIGFDETTHNEAHYARAVGMHLQTEHTEWTARPEDALAIVPELPEIYDEPFADMSQIPTLMVSRMARRDVTVVLSGDAGDELFCGYGRYIQSLNGWKRLKRIPLPLRRIVRSLLPRGRIREGIASCDLGEFYHFINRQWKENPGLVLGRQLMVTRPLATLALEPMASMMYADMLGYLPDDILVKLDRAAMSVSLESRVPLLDHRVIEFAWSLPHSLKHRDGLGKWPLRQILYRYVPRELVDRPKRGFGVPMEAWLRGPLREWADALLDRRRLAVEGHFDPDAVRSEWKLHLSGRRDRHYGLWTVLMFQAWHESLHR